MKSIKKRKHYMLIFIVTVFILIKSSFRENTYFKLKRLISSIIFNVKFNYSIELESNCKCYNSTSILLYNYENDDNIFGVNISIYSNNSKNTKFLYNLTTDEFYNTRVTCNLFSTLRRGKKQKIFSYSLYGKNKTYYKFIKNLSLTIKEFYPDWLLRIYHDDTIDESSICDIQCFLYNQTLLDNVDFCFIKNLNLNFYALYDINEKIVSNNVLDASYIHAMKWRWLPLGDNFVDIFSSRDTDSLIIKREIDSMETWIFHSNKSAHIMRDHPDHGSHVLGISLRH
jgi:hypothetical protein